MAYNGKSDGWRAITNGLITYLVSDNQDVLLSFELHNDRLETDDDVSI